MARITNKFIFFDTLQKFRNRLAADEIPLTSIAFVNEVEVKNAGQPNETTEIKHSFIYTQGQYWYTTLSEDTQDVVAKLETLEDLVEGGYVQYDEVQQTYAPNTETLVNGREKTNELPISSKALKGAIEGLTINSGNPVSDSGKYIDTIKEENGIITPHFKQVAASEVSYDNSSDTGVTATTVQSAIHDIYNFTTNNGLVRLYNSSGNLVQDKNIGVDGTTYTIKQGNEVVANINIPKEMFLRSGEVVYGTLTHSGNTVTFTPNDPDSTGTTVGISNDDHSNAIIKLLIDVNDTEGNDTEERAIYIPAADLVTVYRTGSNSGTDKVVVTVDNSNHTISASVRQGSIEESDLTSALQTKISGKADSSFVGTIPNGATATTVTGYVDEKAAASKTVVEEGTSDSSPRHVTVTPNNTSADGHTIYKINETNIASASYVGTIPGNSSASNVVAYVDEQISALDTAVGGTNLWENGTGTNSTKTKAGNTTAAGALSISAGDHTTTNNRGEAAFGVYNTSTTGSTDKEKTVFSVGIGDSVQPSNGFDVRMDGSVFIQLDRGDINGAAPWRLQDELEWWVEPDPEP